MALTRDLRVMNPTLYLLSYRGIFSMKQRRSIVRHPSHIYTEFAFVFDSVAVVHVIKVNSNIEKAT